MQEAQSVSFPLIRCCVCIGKPDSQLRYDSSNWTVTKLQVDPSLIPPFLLAAPRPTLPCSTSLGSISAAVTRQEEEVAWRERGEEDTSEEEEEDDSEDCEDDDEGEESGNEDRWGCPNCQGLAHPQRRLLPFPATTMMWKCSKHPFYSLKEDVCAHWPKESPPANLMPREEICYQHPIPELESFPDCQIHSCCQCCHHRCLHTETHGTRSLEIGEELHNKECFTFATK